MRAGRRLAYRPSAWRSVTLTLRKPSPTGVVIGPLSATRLRRIDSRTWSGSGVPYSAMTASPASTVSHSNSMPVASRTRRVASASSGPMPSPGIRVTRWAMRPIVPTRRPSRRPARHRESRPSDRGRRRPDRAAAVPRRKRPQPPRSGALPQRTELSKTSVCVICVRPSRCSLALNRPIQRSALASGAGMIEITSCFPSGENVDDRKLRPLRVPSRMSCTCVPSG